MRTTKESPSPEAYTFAVTQVIGSVTVDPYGEGPSPRAAAMQVIAESDLEGTFEFPLNKTGDRTCEVTVRFKEGGDYVPTQHQADSGFSNHN